jgi:phage baseplate assembly protein W
MLKEFLGRGWQFPFQVNPANGGIAFSEYEANIRDCMSLIIGTRPGERQMLPEFGCRINEMLFTPNTADTANLVAGAVQDALIRWEPRIEVQGVDAWADQTGSIRVQVNYTIKSTGSAQELSMMLNSTG